MPAQLNTVGSDGSSPTYQRPTSLRPKPCGPTKLKFDNIVGPGVSPGLTNCFLECCFSSNSLRNNAYRTTWSIVALASPASLLATTSVSDSQNKRKQKKLGQTIDKLTRSLVKIHIVGIGALGLASTGHQIITCRTGWGTSSRGNSVVEPNVISTSALASRPKPRIKIAREGLE